MLLRATRASPQAAAGRGPAGSGAAHRANGHESRSRSHITAQSARRKFFEAAKLNPGDAAATRIVVLIDELFAIDAEARARNLDHAARQALRRAAGYTLALWQKLTRFLEYPELER